METRLETESIRQRSIIEIFTDASISISRFFALIDGEQERRSNIELLKKFPLLNQITDDLIGINEGISKM